MDVANHLGRLLRLAFRQQAAEVGRVLSPKVLHGGQDSPRLEYWPERLAAVVKPLIVQLYQQGITQSRRRLAALQGGKLARVMLPYPSRVSVHPRHTFGEKAKQLGVSFDLFDPLVLRAVDRATLQFCEETNATAVTDLKTAIRKLRVLLKGGLEEGKAIAQLAREVKRIFSDPSRAFRIATTEASRAVHGGALLNAKESSLKLRKEWLASSDACDSGIGPNGEGCAGLDGKQVDLDKPFWVDPKGGAYSVVQHPPLHPH